MGNCSSGGKRCDKCDGRHPTEECKVYTKPREEHPDAQRSQPQLTRQARKDTLVQGCRVVKQPADNHCLYHALSFGFGNVVTASDLRAQLSNWVLANLAVEVKGRAMSQWIAAEYPNDTIEQYAELMCSSSRWGGMPELMGCAILHGITIRVWEKDKWDSKKFKMISKFTPGMCSGPATGSSFLKNADNSTGTSADSSLGSGRSSGPETGNGYHSARSPITSPRSPLPLSPKTEFEPEEAMDTIDVVFNRRYAGSCFCHL